MRYGAAVVVIGLDEDGQAAALSGARKFAQTLLGLLVDKVGFNPNDIISTPNYICRRHGIEEHKTTRWSFH